LRCRRLAASREDERRVCRWPAGRRRTLACHRLAAGGAVLQPPMTSATMSPWIARTTRENRCRVLTQPAQTALDQQLAYDIGLRHLQGRAERPDQFAGGGPLIPNGSSAVNESREVLTELLASEVVQLTTNRREGADTDGPGAVPGGSTHLPPSSTAFRNPWDGGSSVETSRTNICITPTRSARSWLRGPVRGWEGLRLPVLLRPL
jgi:hypothetical protein